MPMALVERMKPWLVAMTLAVPELHRAGFDPAFGIDRHFYDRAKAAGRPVRGLETAAYQIERLDGLPMTVQVEMLRAVLDDVDAQVAAVDTSSRPGRRAIWRRSSAAAAGVPRIAGGLPAPPRRTESRLGAADRRVRRPSRRRAWSSSAAPTWWAPTASWRCWRAPASPSSSSSPASTAGSPAGRAARRRARSTSAPHEAALQVVVHQAHRLHERVDRRRPDERPAAPLQVLRQRVDVGVVGIARSAAQVSAAGRSLPAARSDQT